jgi:hypothetical protein
VGARLRLSLPPATETHTVPLARPSRSRHPPACVGPALIERRFRMGRHEAAQAHGALTSRKCRRQFPAEPGVRMALEINAWRCSVGVAALRDAGCGALRPVTVVWVCHSG